MRAAALPQSLQNSRAFSALGCLLASAHPRSAGTRERCRARLLFKGLPPDYPILLLTLTRALGKSNRFGTHLNVIISMKPELRLAEPLLVARAGEAGVAGENGLNRRVN